MVRESAMPPPVVPEPTAVGPTAPHTPHALHTQRGGARRACDERPP